MSKVYVVVDVETIGHSGYFGSITYSKGLCVFKSKDKAEEYVKKLESSPDYKDYVTSYEIWELDVIE